MHLRQHPESVLADLLAAQQRIVTAEQLHGAGVSRQVVRRLTTEGSWNHLATGVYQASTGPLDEGQRAWVAHLLAGTGSALGGAVALRLAGIDVRLDGDPEAWVPPDERIRSRQGWVRVRADGAGRLGHKRGVLPRIRVEDALLDVGHDLELEAFVGAASAAVRKRLTTIPRLRRIAEARTRLPRGVRAVLDDLAGIESTLEFVYRRDVERAHGLPAGTRQVSHSRGTRSDVTYEPYRLLVELDGRLGHEDRPFRDLWRDNAHASTDLLTLRYGSADVRARPCEVAQQVATALRVRGWRGVFKPCHWCERALTGS